MRNFRRYPKPTKTYYVASSGGSDTNTGQSPALPWATISKVNSSKFNPGDTILFQGAFSGSIIASSHGKAGRLITYGIYGTGTTITNGSGDDEAFYIQKNFIKVTGFNVNGNGEGNCITVRGIGVHIDRNICTNSQTYGILATSSQNECSSCIISNNEVHNGGTSGGSGGSAIGVHSDGTYPGARNITLEDNYCHDWGLEPVLEHGIYCRHVDGLFMRRNRCIDNIAEGITIGNCTRVVIESNTITNNGQGGISLQESNLIGSLASCLIINNEISFSASYDIYLASDNTNVTIINNTIVASAIGIYTRPNNAECVIKNNTIHCGSAGTSAIIFATVADMNNNTCDYNLYYRLTGSTNPCTIGGTSYSLVNFRLQGNAHDVNSIQGNPVFVTNYTNLHLQSSSPCRNIGEVGLGVPSDKDGVVRGASVDLGCFEYV